jgi:hypothetical protein
MRRRGMPDIYGGASTDQSPEAQVLRLSSGHLAAQAIYVFARLGVADLLRDGDKSSAELAELTECNPSALYRVLRFLATVGVVSERDGQHFSLTPTGKVLCSRPSSVVRDNVLLTCSPAFWNSIGGLLGAVRTGENAFRKTHGTTFFDYMEGHPDEAGVFNAAMNSSSAISVAAILSAYDFSGIDVIVDVAGGQGSLLQGILARYPKARGILFDRASVLAGVQVQPAVAERLSKMPGSFFEAIPPGGDVYILRRILHDWDDDRAGEILRRCRQASSHRAKLLIIEAAPPEEGASGNNWTGLDLLMMVLMNGRERTVADFDRLLANADYKVSRFMRTNSPLWIVEATPT